MGEIKIKPDENDRVAGRLDAPIFTGWDFLIFRMLSDTL